MKLDSFNRISQKSQPPANERSFGYDESLILECIACFKEEEGVDLTPEQALSALDQMAALYLAFEGKGDAEPARP